MIPGDFAVSNPSLLTTALLVSDDIHDTVRPVRTAPLALFVDTDSCWLVPTDIVPVDGITSTDDTGIGVTASVAVAVFSPLVAITDTVLI
jgi:hypothetical protein